MRWGREKTSLSQGRGESGKHQLADESIVFVSFLLLLLGQSRLWMFNLSLFWRKIGISKDVGKNTLRCATVFPPQGQVNTWELTKGIGTNALQRSGKSSSSPFRPFRKGETIMDARRIFPQKKERIQRSIGSWQREIIFFFPSFSLFGRAHPMQIISGNKE